MKLVVAIIKPFKLDGVREALTELGVQGLTDTIFFRPEVQLIGWFGVATLAAGAGAARDPPGFAWAGRQRPRGGGERL